MISQKRVLVIDDEYRVGEAIRITLEIMAGWDVLMANSGAEGIQLALTEQPDLILLDWMMPDQDGLMTLNQLQADSRTASLPVIMLTAFQPPEAPEALTKLGVRAVITKPFDPITLAEQIAGILGWPLIE